MLYAYKIKKLKPLTAFGDLASSTEIIRSRKHFVNKL